MLNRFELWMLNRILKKTVIQGGHHGRITLLLSMLVYHARAEYTEDNKVTLDDFLKECFDDALEHY